MSIFEKAFEKAGKNTGEEQDNPLFETVDDFLNIPESLDGEGIKSGLDEDLDSEVWSGNQTQAADSVKQVTLDLSSLRDAGLVDPRSDKTNRTTEEFRRIKRPLLMHARGEGATMVANANMIMVTSALPGEGKTFTAINLAMSIAMEMDKTVLLIDADVAKPDVTARLGVEAEKGLIDVLIDDELTLPQVLLRTDIPKLTLLPSGSRHVHSTELLASERMRQLTLELSNRYSDRIVIFDSPPLLLTNESRVLASLMGQIVLVAEESRTPQHAVKEAVDLLEANEIVGIVMNKGGRKTDGDGYGGYGYYSYGGR
jgi:exopolysaccharide/PEP-CTERM locus tyrosine autokinase